mmetsp:Transcript_8069/g.23126  ORF Transcript_8069/g.23126 Transcript_8069/m.23126 type:complete len:321 (-) Transcript_8069:277-1239(-)
MMDSIKLAVALGSGAAGLLAIAAALWGRRIRVLKRGGVIVTGASSGIGRHAAETLAAEGYTVFAGVRKEADGESLKKVCPAAVPVIMDVTCQDSVDKAMQTVRRHLSEENLSLVALVNNAGIECFFPVEVADMEAAKAVFDVNFFGAMRVAKACIHLLRETGPGARIVNISSLAGFGSLGGLSVYAGSKFAMQALSDSMRLELTQFGIWVCTVNPGFIKTEIIAKPQEAPPPEAAKLDYREVYDIHERMKEGVAKGSSPEVTSRVILHAISSPRPWTRYLVAKLDRGVPAWVMACMMWYLPKQWMDALVIADQAAMCRRQ